MDEIATPAPTTPVVSRMSRAQLEEAYAGLVAEYALTKSVVAILTAELLDQTGGTTVVIRDDEIVHAPDLHAWRDASLCRVLLQVAR